MLHLTTTPRPGSNLGPQTDTLVVEGLTGMRFKLCSIGVVPEGSEARKTFGGPLVPGPWAYTVTHPLVIDCHGGSAAEARRAIPVHVGEPFTIEGVPGTWMLRSPNQRKLEGDGAKLAPYEAA